MSKFALAIKEIPQDSAAPAAEAAGPVSADVHILESLPNALVRKAWFTAAHLLLAPDAKVIDIGCGDGALTFAMAAQNPRAQFTGIDRDKKLIRRAQDLCRLPNLQFVCGDITENFLPRHAFDAAVHSFTLHGIYSRSQCSEKAVMKTLQRAFDLLGPDGILFIQDHAMPPADDFVLLEMPDEPGKGEGIEALSGPELLVSYADQARPYAHPDHRGFYLEELPARFPRTRLFRLPAKWAHEFILRKDARDDWNEELNTEYTFFTERDFRRGLQGMGARVLYTAPHWDEQVVRARFDKKFRLLDENRQPLGPPPTSFVALAQKTPDRASLLLQERRPAREDRHPLRIVAMRDDIEGRVIDVVARDMHIAEILPYRVTEDGRLHVFIHEGLPRALINAVPRNTPNIDGKQWSGHMTEALSLPLETVQDVRAGDIKSLLKFSRDYLSLTPAHGAALEDGPGFYPAPDHIDEHIETRYLRVDPPKEAPRLETVAPDIDGFSTRGRLREFDAQSVLNALAVGVIPTSRLEIQILALYERLKIPYQSWAECPLALESFDPPETTKLQSIIDRMAAKDHRFKEIKGTAGQLRALQSVFVDEGQNDGGVAGLASRTMDFMIPEEETYNTAVILPLARKQSGEVMAGFIEEYLPVPQRYKGNGYVLSCPSLPLPKEITNLELARKYIAEKFEVPLECVARMGESYFCHIGVTPQRIYPFAVTGAKPTGWRAKGRTHGPTQYTPLVDLSKLLYLDNYYSFMKIVGDAYVTLRNSSDISPDSSFSFSMLDRKSMSIGLKGSALSGLERPPSHDAE